MGDRVLLHSPIYSSFKALPFNIQHTDAQIYEDILKELRTDRRKPKTNSLKTMVSLGKLDVLANEQSALAGELKDYTLLRQWIEVGYRRNIAWQGTLTTVIVIIMGLGLWVSFKRFGCPQCRHGRPKMTIEVPVHDVHEMAGDLDRISSVGNMEGHYRRD